MPAIPFALISLFLWPANMAPQIQEPGSRLHLTEIMSVDGSRVGVDFVRIGGMEVAPEGDFFVFDPGAQSLYLFSADGESAREVGERGQGPGKFIRGGRMLVSDDRFTIFDVGQSLVHRFTLGGELVDARRASSVEGTALTVAQDLRGGHWVGASSPSFRFNLADGKMDTPGHVYAMQGDGDDVRVLLEYVTVAAIFYDKTHEVPWGPVSGMIGNSGDWEVVGDSVVVVVDGMSGVVDWYRVDADGFGLFNRIDTGIPGQPVSSDDRRRLVARQTERGSQYISRNTGWLFPERIPGIARMIADSQGFLWLQRYSALDRNSRNWRVIAPGGDRWVDVVLPVGLDVKDIFNNRIFGVTTGALDIPVIKVFEFDRPRLLQGMR